MIQILLFFSLLFSLLLPAQNYGHFYYFINQTQVTELWKHYACRVVGRLVISGLVIIIV
ncbi:hypothetical protein GLYMA_01G168250v4 [Glycine max]|nr:hypothetical protein GLYMA_01G168250v4 [Glycine max]KAH1163502.1 hypothetical protein GYH30_001834 [Glycine max]